MKRPKTSKIVVYTIVEDTTNGLLWVHNRFLCAPSCHVAYTLFKPHAFHLLCGTLPSFADMTAFTVVLSHLLAPMS